MAIRAVLPLLTLLALGDALAASDVKAAKNRPVTKVINLLKDMMKQLEKESEEDEDIYDKMGCWCVTGEKEKTKSIADAQSRVVQLSASIEELGGQFAALNAEVENLQSEIAKNAAALDGATALRKKQLGEFNEEEKDALTSITSLKSAIITLSGHNGAFVQFSKLTDTERDNIAVILNTIMKKHRAMLGESIAPRDWKLLKEFASFMQAPDEYFNEPAITGGSATGGQSSEIFGILKQMKENFETNLASSQKEEVNNVATYEDLKAAKKAEIEASTDQVEMKSAAASKADEQKAQDSQDLEDTKESLAADQQFLADLKTRCANMDAEFEERTKTRQLEVAAVSKALEFLSSDEAHDLFTRTFNPALVQTRSRVVSRKREALAKLLHNAAQQSRDPRLSALAVSARLDAFEEVKKTIHSMIDKLLKEKDDDIKHKDYCIDSFNENERDTANKYRERDHTVSTIEGLASTIDTLDRAIETLKAEVAELQVNLRRASESRDAENKEFQQVVADQRATQKLLAAALDVLKGFYGSFVQKGKRADKAMVVSKQAPPPGFKTYENNAASGGVMGMMQGVIDDSKALEADGIRSETDAKEAYEDFVKDTSSTIDIKSKDIVDKTSEKARDEKSKIQTEVKRDQVLSEIEELEQINADLHKSCDFLMKNFDIRVTARDGEIEALKQGLALFSGASFGALLQHQ